MGGLSESWSLESIFELVYSVSIYSEYSTTLYHPSSTLDNVTLRLQLQLHWVSSFDIMQKKANLIYSITHHVPRARKAS